MKVCGAPTNNGKTCKFTTDHPSGLCLQCDPARTEEWKAEARRRASLGGTVSGAARQRPKRTTCRLRSSTDVLELIERTTLRVENSKGKVTELAAAIAKLASLANEVIKVGIVERENAELKAFIAAHMPEAKGALKAVP